MELSLKEAAVALSRSPRTLRAQLARGDLKGRKSGGVWLVRSEDLPLTEALRRDLMRRVDAVHEVVEDSLPKHVRAARKTRPVSSNEALVLAIELRREVAGGPASLREAVLEVIDAGLVELTYALCEFDPELRLGSLREVRRYWSRALAALLIRDADDEHGEAARNWAGRLEVEVLPKLGGMMRWADQRRPVRRAG